MAKQVLFVQGAGAGAHDEDAKLVASLSSNLGRDYEVIYPLMPDEASPDDDEWIDYLAEEIGALDDGLILVGHSVGAYILVRFLSARTLPQRAAGIFLISMPFFGEGGWQFEGAELPADLEARLPQGVPVFLYQGSADEIVPFEHLDLYAKALPRATVRPLAGRDHQLNNELSEVATDVRNLP